jgi:hypothetical protein
VDDNIIHKLNNTNTHSQQSCAALFTQLAQSYRERDQALQSYIKQLDSSIQQIESEIDTLPAGRFDDDAVLQSRLHIEQGKRRLLRNELTVEEIVRQRTVQEFHKRCRAFQLPVEYTSKYL